VEVARHGFNPRIRDADERLLEVLAGEPDSFEHGTGARAIASVSYEMTAMFRIHKSKSLRQSSRKEKFAAVANRGECAGRGGSEKVQRLEGVNAIP
jgi:hypothetical protein